MPVPDSWDSEEFEDLGFDLAVEDEALVLDETPLAEIDDELPRLDALPAMIDQSGPVAQAIPRIRILATSDRADMAAMFRQAAEDRRMARAEMSVEPGGIDAAIAYCAANMSPDLLILDTIASPRELLEKLERLAEHVDSATKVLIVGASNDIALFRELMRRGVSEYLVPPVTALSLIAAISQLYVNPEKPFAGRSIAVVGAKGGVGASVIAHNAGWLLAERFKANTTILDLDLAFGTAALDFNQEPAQTIAEALLSPERVDGVFLDRSLTRQSEKLMLFCAPATIDKDLDIGPDAYETVIDSVKKTTPFVILDLPHLWSPWVRNCLVSADEIVIVATPELASLRNAKNMLDRIRAARPLDQTPTLVLNMAGVPKRPEIPTKDFAEAIGVQPAVVVPFDPQIFGSAANNGQMVPEIAPQSRVTAALESLATRIAGREAPVQKKASLLDRLPMLKR